MWLAGLSEPNQLRAVLVAGLVLAPFVHWGMWEDTYHTRRTS